MWGGQHGRHDGQKMAKDILLTAPCLAYHNRGSGRFPNIGRGKGDGRWERAGGGGCARLCVFKMSISIDAKGATMAGKQRNTQQGPITEWIWQHRATFYVVKH